MGNRRKKKEEHEEEWRRRRRSKKQTEEQEDEGETKKSPWVPQPHCFALSILVPRQQNVLLVALHFLPWPWSPSTWNQHHYESCMKIQRTERNTLSRTESKRTKNKQVLSGWCDGINKSHIFFLLYNLLEQTSLVFFNIMKLMKEHFGGGLRGHICDIVGHNCIPFHGANKSSSTDIHQLKRMQE